MAVWREEPREIYVFEQSFTENDIYIYIYIYIANAWKPLKMEYAMGPHRLIFDEDRAMGCPMPLDALPTPFKAVLTKL